LFHIYPYPRHNKQTCRLVVHTIPFDAERRKVVNTNFLSLMIWLNEGIEPRSTDYWDWFSKLPDQAPTRFL